MLFLQCCNSAGHLFLSLFHLRLQPPQQLLFALQLLPPLFLYRLEQPLPLFLLLPALLQPIHDLAVLNRQHLMLFSLEFVLDQ